MKKSIVWLASYPKSGNTWTRIFLANYLSDQDKPVPINQLQRFGTGDSMANMYEAVAGQKGMTFDIQTTLQLRPKVLRGINGNNADINFLKTHGTRIPVGGHNLFPAEGTRCAIYLVRNPLDVLLSYARHYGLTHLDALKAMERRDNATTPEGGTVWQFLGSWSDHVQSWSAPAPFPVVIVRYEDLLDDPHTQFARIVQHVGFPVVEERLDKAVRFSSFKEVSRQEEESGFGELSTKSEKFFTKGQSGGWKEDLAPNLAKIMRKSHRKMMKKFDYLT
jgi:hypothetical protein